MVIKLHEDGSITIYTKAYIEKLLNKYNMEDANTAPTPLAKNSYISKCDDKKDIVKDFPYKNLLGGLLFASLTARPDITEAVHQLSIAASAPGSDAVTGAKRVLRYLKGTKDFAIRFSPDQPFQDLTTFADADHASSPDNNRRSITGIIIFYKGGPIFWQAKTQSLTTISSCEAELVAACLATQMTLWIQKVLDDWPTATYQKPTTLWQDNQSTIHISKTGNFKRTKHINVRYYFIVDHHEITTRSSPNTSTPRT